MQSLSRIALVLIAVSVLGFTAFQPPPPSDSTLIAAHEAAQLDPDAYVYDLGIGITMTVPNERTWYLANGMFLDGANVAGDPMWYHRSLDVRRSLALPSGTTVSGTTTRAGHNAFWYVCQPERVLGEAKYLEPESLLDNRLRRLRELPLKRCSVHVPAGSAMTLDPIAEIPEPDGTPVMLVHVSSEDVAWMALVHSTEPRAVNTYWELDNDHRIRVAEEVLLPFRVGYHFDAIKVACANTAGDPSGVAIEGHGTIHYVVLPEDW